jgi:hypothetical protein
LNIELAQEEERINLPRNMGFDTLFVALKR